MRLQTVLRHTVHLYGVSKEAFGFEGEDGKRGGFFDKWLL